MAQQNLRRLVYFVHPHKRNLEFCVHAGELIPLLLRTSIAINAFVKPERWPHAESAESAEEVRFSTLLTLLTLRETNQLNGFERWREAGGKRLPVHVTTAYGVA